MGEPYIRFYAGAAIVVDDVKIGSLCIIDRVPHIGFSDKERMNMLDLGAAVSNLVRERRDASLRSNKECAKMMNEVMRNVCSPLSDVKFNANLLISNIKKNNIKFENVLGDASSDDCKADEISVATTVTVKSKNAYQDIDAKAIQTMLGLESAIAQLHVIIESSICLGEFVVEKAESEKKEWASFTTSNILQTIKSVRKTLEEMSAKVSWDIDVKHLNLGKRHVFSPKALSFVLLNSVEQLASQWELIDVHIYFADTENKEYDCILQQLDDAPICDIESTWKQGLLQIEFSLSNKKDKNGMDGNSNFETPQQNYLSFYTLQQILKDVEGGCTVLDTGSSYSQTMKIWLPCAIILGEKGSDKSSTAFESMTICDSEESEFEKNYFPSYSSSNINKDRDNHNNSNHTKKNDHYKIEPVESSSTDNNDIPTINQKPKQYDPLYNYNQNNELSVESDDIYHRREFRKKASIAAAGRAATEAAATLSAMVDEDLKNSEEISLNAKKSKSLLDRFTGSGINPKNTHSSPTIANMANNNSAPVEIVHFHKLRILLVEDTLTQQKLMGKWLNGQRCVVTFAANGKIGLELLKTKQYDICFMDFLMVRTFHCSRFIHPKEIFNLYFPSFFNFSIYCSFSFYLHHFLLCIIYFFYFYSFFPSFSSL